MKMLWIAAATTAALLQTQIATIAKKADGIVGVAAVDLETGRCVSLHGDERFPMASVVKLPVAIAFLQRVDRGEDSLTREVTLTPADFRRGVSPIRDEANGKPITVTVGRLLDEMVRNSDNSAVDYLMRSVPAAHVTHVLRVRKVKDIDVIRPEGDVIDKNAPDNTATPNGMVNLLMLLARHKAGLSAESEEILLRAMRETETGAHRLRANLPADITIAHKTGTMRGSLNDVGIITSPDGKRHIAIAVFTKGAAPGKEAQQESVVAQIARAIYDDFTSVPRSTN